MPHWALPGATRASTSGSNVSAWIPTASTPARWTSSSTRRSSGGSNWTWIGQPAGLLDRRRAAADVHRAAIAAVERAGGQRHVDRVVEVARRGADLRQLRGRLDRDRLLAARELDAAEPALLGRVPVDALLHHRGRDRVEVQQGDLPVRDAVRRLHVVDPRPRRERHRPDELVVAEQRRAPARPHAACRARSRRSRRARGPSAEAPAPTERARRRGRRLLAASASRRRSGRRRGRRATAARRAVGDRPAQASVPNASS